MDVAEQFRARIQDDILFYFRWGLILMRNSNKNDKHIAEWTHSKSITSIVISVSLNGKWKIFYFIYVTWVKDVLMLINKSFT